MNRALKTILTIFGIIMIWQAAIRIARKLYHFPAPAFIGRWLDSDYRRAIQPPQQIIERSGIRPGMKVLEVGCGSGAYTTHVARAVGPEGEVCALDIQPEMLEQIARKLRRPENQDIRNIRLWQGSAYDLPFDDETFDVVYMITVLQEIPDRWLALAEVNRVLKPNGRLAVTEFMPDPDYPLVRSTIKQGRSAGFIVDEVLGSLWTYTVRFAKGELVL